jgi:hypothetical protein
LILFSPIDEFICLQTQRLYPEARIDVELSSDEDAGPKLDAPADQRKASTDDDTGDEGVSSSKPNTPNQISSSVSKQPDSSTAGQVPPVVPSTSGCGCKCPPLATRRNKPIPQIDQVTTQVELPTYHEPRSPLDLVVIEIIFGRIFEAFRHVSQDVAASAAADDNDRPQKKSHQPPLRKVLAPR